MKKVDVLIIGGGIAALYASIKLPKNLSVLIVTKSKDSGCNSYYAQGGIAASVTADQIPSHIEDTLIAGANLCDKEAVEVLIREGHTVINELIDSGMEFDKDSGGNILLTKEAAHSEDRILHAGGDQTGKKIHQFLSSQNHSEIVSGIAIDLLISDDKCYGATIDQDGKRENIYANYTILATGGFGGLYEITTNADGIMGEMQGLAISKGIELADMHFTQFHPTVFVGASSFQKPLLTEALRGEGAKIVDEDGNRIMLAIDKRAELAPRDIVSRAVFAAQKMGKKIFLDLSGFEKSYFEARFPTVNATLKAFGFNAPADLVPISPAFHYSMGGIATDTKGKVAKFDNLYAVGEVARTGVHGANRLASNSLLEALVFAKLAARDIEANFTATTDQTFLITDEPLMKEADQEVVAKIRKLLWQNAGIVRKNSELIFAKNELESIEKSSLGLLASYSLTTAKQVVEDALVMKISVGAHFLEEE